MFMCVQCTSACDFGLNGVRREVEEEEEEECWNEVATEG